MAEEYVRKADAIRTCGGYGELARIMSYLPPADVAPVVHGQWIHLGCGVFGCDKCGEKVSTNVYVREEASDRFKFCPNCGAKMDREE